MYVNFLFFVSNLNSIWVIRQCFRSTKKKKKIENRKKKKSINTYYTVYIQQMAAEKEKWKRKRGTLNNTNIIFGGLMTHFCVWLSRIVARGSGTRGKHFEPCSRCWVGSMEDSSNFFKRLRPSWLRLCICGCLLVSLSRDWMTWAWNVSESVQYI
jgi:hypothetical protein